MSFLLDTDTCSAHLKSNFVVTGKLLVHAGHLHISTVTQGELLTWALRAKAPPQRRQAVLDFFDDVVVLDVTPGVAAKFAEVRAHLLDIGHPGPDLDLLIAATALVHDLMLITHNVRDFVSIPGLKIEDWLAS